MATVQSTYSERLAPNPPGTIQGSDFEVETGICETAAPGGIPFGRAVSQGTLSDQGVVLGGTLAKFRGVSVKVVTLGAEDDIYVPPNNVDVLHKGSIWVEPSVAVNVNDPVWFDGTSGLFNKSTGIGPIKGARWKTTCGVGGRALVSLSGYNLTGT